MEDPDIMRLCFYSPFSLLEGGGVENWLIEIAKRLAGKHKISIVTLRYFRTKRINHSDLTVLLRNFDHYEFPFVKFPVGNAVPNLFYIRQIVNLFNAHDLVYVVIPYPPNEALFFAFKKAIKSKLMVGFHSYQWSNKMLQKLYMPFFEKSISSFEAYHVLNKKLCILLKNKGLENIYYIPNGVDTKKFHLCRDARSEQTFKILFSGRLSIDKGVDFLTEIIQLVNKRLNAKSIKFIIIGSGPLEDKIGKNLRKHENVDFLGFVHPELLPEIYREAHLFLIPSRTEGMPLRLLEAQSCGLPAVGSNIPGISDIVINGKTGKLVDAGNIGAFVEAINEYYLLWHDSPERYFELNKAIREHIVSNYDWGIIIGKIEKMFKELYNLP